MKIHALTYRGAIPRRRRRRRRRRRKIKDDHDDDDDEDEEEKWDEVRIDSSLEKILKGIRI